MKIALEENNTKNRIVNLIVDGTIWRELPTAIFGKKPAFPKNCTSFEELEELFDALEYRSSLRYTLELLSRAMSTTKKVMHKLETQGIRTATACRVVAYCCDNRYLDDTAWAEAAVRSEMRKKKGRQYIMMKLITAGIDREIAAEALDKEYSGAGDAIKRLLLTTYRSRDLSTYAGRAAVIGSLLRKGFDRNDIENALGEEACEIERSF